MKRRRKLKKFSKARVLMLALCLVICAIFSLFEDNSRIPAERCILPDAPKLEPKSKDSIRICTWNVRNYNVSNRRVNGRWLSYPKPESERNIISDVLTNIDADVLLLQEMGDMTYLNDLISRLAKQGQHYPYAAISGDNSPIRLAILSKIKPDRFFDFSDIKIKVKKEKLYSLRGTLGAKFKLRNKELFVFNLHLKSKINAKKQDENFIPFRFAELRAIRKCVKKVAKDDALILYTGDFNDEPTKALIRNLRNVELVEQKDALGQDYTYHWSKKNIFYKYDFFLITAPLKPFIIKATVSDNKKGSDHRPVYVDINLPTP